MMLLCLVGPAQAQPAAPGRTVAVNGAQIHYVEHGSGEPLLLLHGFGSCGSQWDPAVETLARRYRVIVPDLRGHGRSTNPEDRFSMRQSARDMIAFLDRLGIDRVRAIGISAGGMTLMHMARLDSARIPAMVLVGATPRYPESLRAIARGAVWETMPAATRESYRRCATRGEAQMRALIGQFHAFADSHDDMDFSEAALASISARTLIVHGDRDQLFPLPMPLVMRQSIPRSELWIIAGGGHVPIFRDQLPEFLRVVDRFFADGG